MIGEKKRCAFVTFETTTDAMRIEMACQKAGIAGRLIPVPGSIRAGCGMGFKSDPENAGTLQKLLEQEKVTGAQIITIRI